MLKWVYFEPSRREEHDGAKIIFYLHSVRNYSMLKNITFADLCSLNG